MIFQHAFDSGVTISIHFIWNNWFNQGIGDALLSLPLAETPTRMACNTNSLGQTSIKMRSQAEKLGIYMIYTYLYGFQVFWD